MENNGYYSDKQGYYYEKPQTKRRGAGGYILTAIIAFIVGVLVTSVFLTSGGGRGLSDLIGGAIPDWNGGAMTPELQPAPTPTPATDGAFDSSVPALTPTPTERPMPALDGVAPNVFDSVNPVPDVIEQVSPGVVGIVNYQFSNIYQKELEAATGSGFVISTEGYIVTNAHVVDGAVRLGVLFVDGDEAEAELIGYDKSSDIAVLKVDVPNISVLKLGNSEDLRVGEFVITIGDPTGRELAGTATFGIVSATKRSVNIDGVTNDYIQTDAAVNPGNSGGPLINMSGEVIGITSAKTVTASYDEYGNAISAEGLGFALPMNDAMKIIEQLITTGEVKRPGLGVSVISMDELYSEHYSIPQGMLIYSITKDGPAHKAGFEINDIITGCNGEPTLDQDAFVSRIKGMAVGDTVEFTVWRFGEEIKISVVLADLNTLGDELVEGQGDPEAFKKD